ncbi:MAG TPA: hypothetical protein VJR02_12515 [Pyrinomonadaceae bacterium]|nr:hypothetical protein [Pyrinomonadaceae bacterium]
MTNEIFRFVNLRPPQDVDVEQNDIVIFDGKNSSPFHTDLRRLKQSGKPRSSFEDQAKKYVESGRYALGSSPLPLQLEEFAEWFLKQRSLIPVQAILDHVSGQLGTVLPKLLKSDDFRETRTRVADSVIAANILPSLPKEQRDTLFRFMKIIGLLERMSDWSDNTVNRDEAMSARLLLPEDVFPLPSSINPHDQILKQAAEKNLERHTAAHETIKNLSQRLKQLKSGLEEVVSAYSADTNDSRRGQSSQDLIPIAVSPAGRPGRISILSHATSVTSPVLSTTRATALSAPTKTLLNQLNIPGDFVDVHHTSTMIEREIAAVSEKLFNGRGSTTLVRIGDIFTSVNDLSAEAIDGSDKVPGACLQTLPESPIVSQPTVPNTSPSSIRPIGIADLLQVRQKIKRYVPGEIAHIENIMMGESKKRNHRQSTRIVEARLLETETTKEDSRDLQTAERFELQQETSEVIKEEASREVGVSMSASYGPFAGATVNLNFVRANTREENNKTATRFSREITDKAVQRTQERVLERRTVTTEREFEETNKHGFDNKLGDAHVVGIYRWVDKIYEAQVVSYGLRMIFEFVVPEPAALYKHALTVLPKEGVSFQRPDPPGYCMRNTKTFISLTPGDIDVSNYLFWVSKYGVNNVAPPPPTYKIIGTALGDENKNEDDSSVIISNEEMQVPSGYRAVKAWVKGNGTVWPESNGELSQPTLGFYVGRTFIGPWASAAMHNEDGIIPLAVFGYRIASFSVTIEVLCERSREAYETWQIETYNAILSAYNEKKSQFDSEMTRLEATGQIQFGSRPPEINRDIERTELKRASISMLTGQHFDDFDAMRRGVPQYGYPQMDLAEAQAEGNYIQFFEQAFEWVNSTYRFYPYYWARKDDWPKYLQLDERDPIFAKFLQAGAARIQVPVRPGFESAVSYFLLTGNRPWEEESEFNIDGSLYVSMIDEIREETRGAFTKGLGTISVQQGSAVVIGTDTKFNKKLHTDRDIMIQDTLYRIEQVTSPTELLLVLPSRGSTESGLSYSFGARLVGDPWEVRVPTNLVYLQESNALPDFDLE